MSAGEGELDGADTSSDVPPGDAVEGDGDPDSGDMTTDRLRDDAESDPMNPQTESVNVEPETTREDVSPLGITSLERRRLQRARQEARDEAARRTEAQAGQILDDREPERGEDYQIRRQERDGEVTYGPSYSGEFAEALDERQREQLREQTADEAGEDYSTEDVVVTEIDGGYRAGISEEAQKRELREDILSQVGGGFTGEDVTFSETEEGLQAGISEEAQKRELREDVLASAEGDFTAEDVTFSETEEGLQAGIATDALRREGVESFLESNPQFGRGDVTVDVADGEVSVGLTEQAQQEAQQQAESQARSQAVSNLLGEVGDDYSRSDVSVSETGDGFRAELEGSAVRRELREDVLAEAGEGFTGSDVTISETDDGYQASISEGAVRRELREDVLEQAGEEYSGSDIVIEETDEGYQGQISEDAQQRELGELILAQQAAQASGMSLPDDGVSALPESQQEELAAQSEFGQADIAFGTETVSEDGEEIEQLTGQISEGAVKETVRSDVADELGGQVQAGDVIVNRGPGEDDELGTEDDVWQARVNASSIFNRLRDERSEELDLRDHTDDLQGSVGQGGEYQVFVTEEAARREVTEIVEEHAQNVLREKTTGRYEFPVEYRDENLDDWLDERGEEFGEIFSAADPDPSNAKINEIVEDIDLETNLSDEGKQELKGRLRELSWGSQFDDTQEAIEFQLGDDPGQTRVIEDAQGVDQPISLEQSRELREQVEGDLEERFGTDISYRDFTIGESAVDVGFQAETQAQIINDPQTPAAREYSREVRRQVASDLDAQTAADVTAGDIGEATVDGGEVQIGVADGTPSTLQQDAAASRRRALEGIGFEGVGTENFLAPEAPGQTTLAEQQQRQALEGIGFEGVGTGDVRAPDAPGQATLVEQQRQQALEGIGAGAEYQRRQTLQAIDEQVETSVGRQRARELGITPSLVGGDLSRLADLQRGEDYTVQQTDSETTAELTEEFQREFAAGKIERELEEQTGADITRGDIELTQTEDGGFRGRLTEDAQQRIGVEQEPLVQLTEGTPFEGVFQTGATIGAEQAAQRAERRETLFDRIGARDEAEAALRSIGLGGAIEGFENLQTETRSAFDEFRQGLFQTGGDVAGEAGARLETGAALLAAPLVGGVEQAGVEPEDVNIPSPSESPEEFAAAAAPFAATEPSPLGELAVAGALVGAGALAARERVSQPSLDPARAEATAQGVGLFAPEQEIPEGGDLFVSEQEVEPPSYDIPELLPPTDASVGEGTPSPTPPEIEQPQEAIGRGFFPAEQAQPSQPIGRGFFQSEVDVPTARAASALQQGEATVERSRVRRRRDRSSLPESFIPDEPATIGGETIERGGQVSESPGPRFVFRPNPRSMDLYRIETDEGGFRVGPEYTRFLESQPLDSDLGPEVEPIRAADTLPPAQRLGGEFAAAGGVRAGRQRSFLEEEAARASVDPFGDRGLPLPDELGGERADTGPFDIADRRADAGVDEFQRDQAVPDILDRVGEDLGQPQDTATSPFAASDTVQDQRQQERQEFGQPSDTVRTTTVDPFEFESPFADLTAEATGEFAYEYAFEFPTGRRRPRLDLDDRDEDDPVPEDLADPYAFRQERELINPFLGE